MNTLQTKLLPADTVGIAAAAKLLQNGETVAIPTETVYGLAADALNPTAVRRIFEAKGRPADNPLIVHIADIADWETLVTDIPPVARALADAFWPGPLTIILPAAPIVPKITTGGLATVAVRFPAHPVAQAVIKASGCMLAAPSANRSGSPSPTNATRTMDDLRGRIAAVIDGGDADVGGWDTELRREDGSSKLLRFYSRNMEKRNVLNGMMSTQRWAARTALVRRAGGWNEELNAYRRAESAERRAMDRVNQMYDKANGALADASVRLEENAERLSDLAMTVQKDLDALRTALGESRTTLANTAVVLGAIRPQEN